jgi:hypothetical protein
MVGLRRVGEQEVGMGMKLNSQCAEAAQLERVGVPVGVRVVVGEFGADWVV